MAQRIYLELVYTPRSTPLHSCYQYESGIGYDQAWDVLNTGLVY
jgi:hypothetical protein